MRIHHQDTGREGSHEALQSWARSLPKIDLHRHLEGSLRLTTIAELASSNAIDLPTDDLDALRSYVQVSGESPGFASFLEKFKFLRRLYTSRDVVQRVTREAVTDAALDHVVYLELRFNPLALAQEQQISLSRVVGWVMEAVDQAQTDNSIRVCLILQIPRNEPLSVANQIVDLAISCFGPLVRGIDLAGDEVAYPPERFIEPFARARRAGLNITVHAGEAMGAESVRSALLYLHPQRIGHGIRSVENSRVVQMLRRRGVALEVCPTSNYHTGAVREFTQHPLLDLFNLGLRVTLNTDDPSVSATTLADEVVVAVERIGLSPQMIYRMLAHSAEAAFLPPTEKQSLIAAMREGLASFPGALEAFEAAQQAD